MPSAHSHKFLDRFFKRKGNASKQLPCNGFSVCYLHESGIFPWRKLMEVFT